MTEQEKREKAIEEMQCDIAIKCELHEMSGKCVIGDCARCKLGLLYDAGYRKKEEVQKETAKEILEALLEIEHKSVCNAKSECEWWSAYNGCNKLNKEQCAEYGLFRTWSKENISNVFQRFDVEVEND